MKSRLIRMTNCRQSTVRSVTMAVSRKNRRASGTLFAPMQFPMIAQDASWKPRGISKRIAQPEVMMVCTAYASTLISPEMSVRTSKAHHSAQIMTVDGKDTFKYSDQPLKLSFPGMDKARLISGVQWQ